MDILCLIEKAKILTRFNLWLICLLLSFTLSAQQGTDSLIQNATLENVVRYALRQNPQLRNASIDEEITETAIKSRLADWYPQVNFNYNFQHNFKLPVSNFNGQLFNIGLENTSGAQFSLTQNVFNRDIMLASRTARDVRLQAKQNTTNQKINVAVAVSKAFYEVILTIQQLHVIDEDIIRISNSFKDAYQQYWSEITDKTDHKRASISLNNAKAQKKNTEELLKARYAYLKELMGYPPSLTLDLKYDTIQLESEFFIDTLQTIAYGNRIEYQLLQTQKNLLQYNLTYNKWSFLPDVSLFGNYNVNYLNNDFSKLYNRGFPNLYAGVLLSVPIFQGGKRLQLIKQARFQLLQADNEIHNLENSLNTQYTEALASYKSNLYNYLSQKENVALAKEVYDVIQLQYRSGIKTYLEVINSQADLRTAQINLYNSLYQLLSSKIEVQQSLGTVSY